MQGPFATHRNQTLYCFLYPASRETSRGPSFHRRLSCETSCRPGPLKVETADSAVTVENFPDQVETRHQARFNRAEVNLFERDSSGCHLGIVPAPIAFNRKWKFRQGGSEPFTISAWKLRNRMLRIAPCMPT